MERPASHHQSASDKAAQARFGAEAQARTCDHPDCAEAGLHRAPVGRDRPGAYFWFCLEHVRAYNRSWDWFAGMSEAEIEAQRRRDQTWGRPTWSFAGSAGDRQFDDPFDLFAEERAETRHRREQRRRHARTEEEKALAELDLTAPVTLAEIKIRYKFLAKQLHPDANGGDAATEDRLKAVNRAYTTLKTLYGAKAAERTTAERTGAE